MSAKSESIVKSLLESIKSPSKETQPYDTSATVTRVEDDTVFVHIPGGVAETPCSKTINCKVGDTVQVRVGGGKAWLVGNASAPPTDDTTANTAIRKTNQLGDSLTKLQKIAGNTDQYFWHVETGEDTGSHITEIPKERFLEAPALGGGNLLLRSNGIAIRNGLNELATFSGSAIQFNQPGTSTVVATIGTSGLYIQKGVIKLGSKTSSSDVTNSGTFIDESGNIATSSIKITGGYLRLGNKTSASDTTNTGTYIDNNGNMSTSNIIATGGTVGGWSIEDGYLSRVYGGTTVSLVGTGLDFESSTYDSWYRVNESRLNLWNSAKTYSLATTYMQPGTIYVYQDSTHGDAAVHVQNGPVYHISLDAAPSGNRGIWDYVSSKWMIYHDTNNYAHIGSPVLYCGNTFNTDGQLHLGDEYGDAVHLSAVWSDASYHDIITRNASEAITYFGYASATTVLRGSSCRLNSSSGSTITSDRNVKKNISTYDSKYDAFYDALNPVSYQFINGTSGRTHCGFISQDVRNALISSGLSTTEFGGYIREDIENREIDSDGQDVPLSNINYLLDHDINEIHELIYSEFIALNTWQIQKLKARVAELEAKHE